MRKTVILIAVLTAFACLLWACGDEVKDEGALSEDSVAAPSDADQSSNHIPAEETSAEESVSFESEDVSDETSEAESSEVSSEETSDESVADHSTSEHTQSENQQETIPDLILTPQPEGEYHILRVGESLKLYSEIEGAGIEDAMLVWQVSDPTVIRFSAKTVTALSPGYSTVTLSYSNGLKPVSVSFMVIEEEESSEESIDLNEETSEDET